jgi:hypothetical protein
MAVHPAASPETDRSWPAVAVDTSKSRATSASTGEIAITAACPANRHRKSVRAGGGPARPAECAVTDRLEVDAAGL